MRTLFSGRIALPGNRIRSASDEPCCSPHEPTPKTSPLQRLFVALYVCPHPRGVAMWLFGTVADDVERAVVVLDVGVAEAHIFVGITVLECHGNCHSSNLQLRRPMPARDRQ